MRVPYPCWDSSSSSGSTASHSSSSYAAQDFGKAIPHGRFFANSFRTLFRVATRSRNIMNPWRPFNKSVGILTKKIACGLLVANKYWTADVLMDHLPELLHPRPDGEWYQFKDPGNTHNEHQFNIQQAFKSQDSQLTSRVIAILMPQTPTGHSEIDHV